MSTGQTGVFKAKRSWAIPFCDQTRILPILIPSQRHKGSLLTQLVVPQEGETLQVEKCFPSTPHRRKKCSPSAGISQPNLLLADVKEPLTFPHYSSDSEVCHQHMLQPLGLSSAHKDSRDSSSPLLSRMGTVSYALALSETPYGLAFPDNNIYRQIFGHHAPTRYVPVFFF